MKILVYDLYTDVCMRELLSPQILIKATKHLLIEQILTQNITMEGKTGMGKANKGKTKETPRLSR